MIEESYVSFDIAKLLKEAGFDVPCYVQYSNIGVQWDASYPENFNADDWGYSCPTQALAEKWLREVYNIAIYSLYDDMEQWFYVVDAFTKNPVIDAFQSGSEYDSYEEALEAGLQEAIKLIKK